MEATVTCTSRQVIASAAEQIVKAGYALADCNHVRKTSLDFISDIPERSKAIGILKEQTRNKGAAQSLYDLLHRSAEYVASISFQGNGATSDNWVMTVGRTKNSEEMGRLADGLSKRFGVGVTVIVKANAGLDLEMTEAEHGSICMLLRGF